MIIGSVLLKLAFICGLIAVSLLALYDSKRFKLRPDKAIRTATRAAFFFLSMAMFMMVWCFIAGDYSILYVWQYCNNEMSLSYKIAAVFAGQQGTYLLWAWTSFLFVWIVMEEYRFRNPLHRTTVLIALVVSIFILLLCIVSEPFKPILDMIGYIPADGNGLNPVFLTVWMIIHPFITFISYAATIIPASAAAAHLITGKSGWHRISKQWIRVSWFCLSICMATGGAWAYKLVGWNGFWNWDPVQTAMLVLWMLLTAAVHVLARYNEGKEYTTAAPVFTIFLFAATIYVTLITRQGIIHSLHDFPGTETAGLLVMGILVVGTITIVLSAIKFVRVDVAAVGKKAVFSLHNTFLCTVLLLTLIAFISCWGVTYSFISQHVFDTKVIIPPEFFNVWCYVPVLLLTILTGICMAYGKIDDTYLKYLVILVSTATILLALVPSHPLLDPGSEFAASSSIFVKMLGSISMWSFLPPFLFALITTIYKFLRDIKKLHGRLRIRSVGINLVHIGFVLVVLGAIVTTSFDIEAGVTYRVSELGTKNDIGHGWAVELTKFDVIQNPDGTWTQTAYLSVYKDDKFYCSGATGFVRTNQYGDVHDPMIDRSIMRDVYVQFQGTRSHISTEAVVPLSIRIVPWISLLWAGCITMIIGIYCIIISIYLLAMRRREIAAEIMRR
jgi:cytochrome c-type biogenesis protein CcmF